VLDDGDRNIEEMLDYLQHKCQTNDLCSEGWGWGAVKINAVDNDYPSLVDRYKNVRSLSVETRCSGTHLTHRDIGELPNFSIRT
jgi:hypothetical protein